MTPDIPLPNNTALRALIRATDIYSLGATLYAALSGIIPEDGLRPAMDNTQLTPLRKRNGKVSRRFAALLKRQWESIRPTAIMNAEDFKHSLLGSKTKTQKLPVTLSFNPCHPKYWKRINKAG